MSQFVVDCSVTMSWFFGDEASDYVLGVLALLESGECCVPAVWCLEVINVLLVAERRRRIASADTTKLMRPLQQLPIHVDELGMEQTLIAVLGLGRKYNLSSYDAAYLELAIRKELPLATLDVQLSKAAKRAGVPLL